MCLKRNRFRGFKSRKFFSIEPRETEKTAGILDDSISNLTKMIKKNNYLSNVTGVAKKETKKKLDDMMALGDNFKNTSGKYKSIKNNMDNINNKMNDVDKYLPNLNNKIDTAKQNLETLKLGNKTVLERTKNQGFVKNLFDSEGRKANKQISGAEKQLNDLNKRKGQAKQNILSDLNSKLDKNKADMKDWEDKIGITELNGKISDTQKAYDKATRNTRNARIGTMAGIGAVGYGIKQSRNKTNPIEQENYYPNLNNSF